MRYAAWLALILLCASCQNSAPVLPQEPALPAPSAAPVDSSAARGLEATRRALAALEASAFEQAETQARQACSWLAGKPDQWQALLALGDALFLQDRVEQALEAYTGALAEEPPRQPSLRFHGAWIIVAMIHVQLSYGIMDQWGEPDAANFQLHSDQAIEVARRGIAQLESLLPSTDDALRSGFEAACKELRQVELQCLLDLPERSDEAEIALKAAIDRQPEQRELHVQLGTLLERRADLQGARRAYQAALLVDPEAVELHRLLGTLAYREASELQQELLVCEEAEQRVALEEQLAPLFRTAQEHLEVVCAQQPDAFTLTALSGIASQLGDPEAYARYQHALRALEGAR